MPARITRVELAIIVAALVVLMLTNQPPEPGNAGIRLNVEGMTVDAQEQTPQTMPVSPPPAIPGGSRTTTPPTGPATDNLVTEPLPPAQPKRKRIAMVDARECDSLKYPEVMYGEVTARPVWNGTKFEWRKVCEVKEKNGTTSVWCFDEPREGVIVTELQQEP